ncbi:MAG: hypothetical protein P8L68_07620 [Paracoccaceae bacterium]|nr:hypothetical protein [Paracoccaceae bacterium]
MTERRVREIVVEIEKRLPEPFKDFGRRFQAFAFLLRIKKFDALDQAPLPSLRVNKNGKL